MCFWHLRPLYKLVSGMDPVASHPLVCKSEVYENYSLIQLLGFSILILIFIILSNYCPWFYYGDRSLLSGSYSKIS